MFKFIDELLLVSCKELKMYRRIGHSVENSHLVSELNEIEPYQLHIYILTYSLAYVPP